MKSITVLIVEDKELDQKLLENDLRKSNFNCILSNNGKEALELLKGKEVDVILSDQRMPEMDGMELLREVKSRYGDLPFIMLTAVGTIDKAVASIKRGATDYIQKPYNLQELLAVIQRAINYYHLSEENRKIKKQLRRRYGFQNIITTSAAMQEALEKARMVCASTNTTVAIFGESGTGKEILARAIHSEGEGMENRFIAINCAGIPANLLESELFGHVKGAFTGAERDREGKFDLAQKGTILLDEIGDMPIELQAKLLRVLQEKVYERVGSSKPVKADFRIIIATHRNLEEMVKNNRFREDLFYRISAFPIILPPLRERKEDIPLLARRFLDHFRKELGKPLPGISNEAMDFLVQYNWPGNVRELKNCIERAAILTRDELIQKETLFAGTNLKIADKPHPETSLKPVSKGRIEFNFSLNENEASIDNIVKESVNLVLQYCDNNKSRAAQIIKKNRSFFYRHSR